jgi:hypothetical protein
MATRTPATGRPASARFSRSAGPSTQRPSGRRASAATSRRPSIVPRRTPQKTGMAKLVEGVSGALPGARARNKAGGGGGKGRTAGLAMLAGAAGLAFKNRDKLQGMLRRKGSDAGDTTVPVVDASATSADPAADGVPGSPAAPGAVPPMPPPLT